MNVCVMHHVILSVWGTLLREWSNFCCDRFKFCVLPERCELELIFLPPLPPVQIPEGYPASVQSSLPIGLVHPSKRPSACLPGVNNYLLSVQPNEWAKTHIFSECVRVRARVYVCAHTRACIWPIVFGFFNRKDVRSVEKKSCRSYSGNKSKQKTFEINFSLFDDCCPLIHCWQLWNGQS